MDDQQLRGMFDQVRARIHAQLEVAFCSVMQATRDPRHVVSGGLLRQDAPVVSLHD